MLGVLLIMVSQFIRASKVIMVIKFSKTFLGLRLEMFCGTDTRLLTLFRFISYGD